MIRFMAAALMMMAIGSCTKPKDLEFVDIQNIRMIKWGLSESVVGLDVRLYNPNNQQVKLKDVLAKVYANSTYLGDTQTDSIITVPRRDTFAVPLTLKIQTASTIAKVMETLSDTAVIIKVDGNVKMGKAGVFVNYPIRYEQAQKMSDLKLGF